jgi:RNA polymerase sigma-70 factor (sigma-E family)
MIDAVTPERDEPPIIAVVSDGRDSGLRNLYETEYVQLVRTASLLVDDRSSAEDVVQDAFVKLHTAWDRIREGTPPAAYLRAIVINNARSTLRHRGVVRRTRPSPRPEPMGPDETAVVRDEHRMVIDALARLPRRAREVLVLRYYGDLSEREIAESLGIAQGTVKSYAHDGMKRLAATLEATP